MGRFLDKFKSGSQKVANRTNDFFQKNKDGIEIKDKLENQEDMFDDFDDFQRFDELDNLNNKKHNYRSDWGDEVGIQPAQKPESFHHFILENQYKDLERSIRGFKDVYDKDKREWITIRKKEHCFTDEEAEEILRTAQSHLATDIKLGYINKEAFPKMMDTIYQEIAFLFESIAEYRYGRYGSFDKQYDMKLQNFKIFLELYTRVQANYSRAIQGTENRLTHSSVRGQESLQSTESRDFERRRYS